MKSLSKQMAERSVEALTAAVCAYNRPADPYRIEQFAILLCNAWELLLKARILQLNKNKVASIAAYGKRKLKDGTTGKQHVRRKTRGGQIMTIGMLDAYKRLDARHGEKLPPVVQDNLEAVVELRDTSVHFIHTSSEVLFEAHEVFAASVSNLLHLLREWFALSYDHLGPTVLPLALAGTDLSVSATGKEKRLVKFLQAGKRNAAAAASDKLHYALHITVEAKKSTSDAAAHYWLTKHPADATLRLEEEDLRERFPWTYDMVRDQCRKRYIDFKQGKQFNEAMKRIKADPALHHRRLLDKDKPDGQGKDYYSTNVWNELDRHWTRKKAAMQPAA